MTLKEWLFPKGLFWSPEERAPNTTLGKVLTYCHKTPNFTFGQFEKKFGKYPCGATNYLSMLVRAGYVDRYARGKYSVRFKPSLGLNYGRLKQEAYGK